jgi:tetratricopeptide (TPR) repeat protein
MDMRHKLGASLLVLLASQAAHAGLFDNMPNPFGNPKFDLNIEHPPAVALKVTTIAIGKPEGQCSEDLAARVEEDFVGAGVTVIDRQRFEDLLTEHKLQVGAIFDQKTAARIGAMIGAQALIFLKTLDCHSGSSQKTMAVDKKGNASYQFLAQGNVSGSVRVVNLATGQVIAAQRIEGSGQVQSFSGAPDPSVAMEEAEKNAALMVHKLLLRWKETKHITFFNDSQCNLKLAAGMIKAQDVDGALKQSESNLADCREQPKIKLATMAHAYYNLGVLQFMKDDFDVALTNLSEAQKLDSSQTYIQAAADCKRAKALSVQVGQYEEDRKALVQDTSAPSGNSTAIGKKGKKVNVAIESKDKPGVADASVPSSAGPSVADRLAKLNELLKKGLITQDEYNQKRSQILGGI